MWRLLQRLLDIILPRRERTVRIEEYEVSDFLVTPTEHELCGVRVTTLLSYRSQATEDVIRALKYDGSAHAAQLLADILAEYLREEIASRRLFSTMPMVLVPIPLHRTRERERGFNQIEKVLEKLPREFRDGTVASVENILERTRDTAPQTRLSRRERLENVRGAFALHNASPLEKAHYILIDDVTTTGATLAEAGCAFEDSSASLTLLALARA